MTKVCLQNQIKNLIALRDQGQKNQNQIDIMVARLTRLPEIKVIAAKMTQVRSEAHSEAYSL